MRILVTGGSGSVGGEAVKRLVQNGHTVRVIGRREHMELAGAEYVACDINDYEALRAQVAGMEAIVHLAAIPHPSRAPGQEIFRVNCCGTFNVYEAAAREGIRRVVTASSINAFGYNFGIKNFALEYFPIDEEHPSFTTEPYSFSKQITEEIADYYWRREGISGICMRLPAVLHHEELDNNWFMAAGMTTRQAVEEFQSLLPAERQRRLAEIIALTEQLRAARTWEGRTRPSDLDPTVLQLVVGRNNFWAVIDARDSAQAIEKALLASYEGSHPLFINDSHNATSVDAELLVESFFPEVTQRKRPMVGHDTLVSIDQARALIGYEPEYHLAP